jgi:hypothetical protein
MISSSEKEKYEFLGRTAKQVACPASLDVLLLNHASRLAASGSERKELAISSLAH